MVGVEVADGLLFLHSLGPVRVGARWRQGKTHATKPGGGGEGEGGGKVMMGMQVVVVALQGWFGGGDFNIADKGYGYVQDDPIDDDLFAT